MPTTTRLILCEGFEDVQLVKRLIAARGLPTFRVDDTAKKPDRRGGIHKFRSKLSGLRTSDTKWFSALTRIILVADNDLTPAQNFQTVVNQLSNIFPASIIPTAPFQPSAGNPRLAVAMTPAANAIGNLETMLGPAARQHSPSVSSFTDMFLGHPSVATWDDCKKAKAWIRANLTLQVRDPCAPIGEIIRDDTRILNMRDAVFDPLANLIAAMA